MELDLPGSVNLYRYVLMSTGFNPGIPLPDGRKLELNYDVLFGALLPDPSAGGAFTGVVGPMPADATRPRDLHPAAQPGAGRDDPASGGHHARSRAAGPGQPAPPRHEPSGHRGPVSAARAREWRDFYEYEADTYAITPEAEPAFLHRRTLVRRLLARRGRAALDGPVLDVGCGDGALAQDLQQRLAARVVAVDLSVKRVQRAASRVAGLPVCQAGVYALPFRSGSFALVVCTDLLEHLDDRRPPCVSSCA
jgi:hypothetical protein